MQVHMGGLNYLSILVPLFADVVVSMSYGGAEGSPSIVSIPAKTLRLKSSTLFGIAMS